MVEAAKWDSASNGKEEHSSVLDADLEAGDEETTTSTQYSGGQAHHSSSTASCKVSFRGKRVKGRGGKKSRKRETHARELSVYVCLSRPRHNLVRVHIC